MQQTFKNGIYLFSKAVLGGLSTKKDYIRMNTVFDQKVMVQRFGVYIDV